MKKDPIAVALAKRRMTAMTADERKEVAQNAARSRWDLMSEEEKKAEGARLAAARAAKRKATPKKAKKT